MSNGNPPHSPSSLEPHATISAQGLAQSNPDHCGFLRKRGQRERVLENVHLSKHINWRQRYVILKDGCCYCFADEVAKSPLKTFSLEGYNRVSRSTSDRATFVFILEPASDRRNKLHTFAATSDQDRKVWMNVFREAMMRANSVSSGSSGGRSDPGEYVELERPVYEPSAAEPSRTVNMSVSDESSDDSDYDKPEDILPPPTQLKGTERRGVPLPPVPQGNGIHDHTPTTRALPVTPPVRSPPNQPRIPHNRETGPPPQVKPKPPEPLPKRSSGHVPGRPALPDKSDGVRSLPKEKPRRRLSEKDCLFDNSDREAAIGILRDRKTPGTFLIRKSRQGDSKVLAVMTTEDVKEYKIFTENNQVSLDKKVFFHCVDDLLDHYNSQPLPHRQQTLGRSFSSDH